MSYSKFDIDKVRKAADIRNHIPGIVEIKRKSYVRCPNCGADGAEGMLVTQNSRLSLAKCFKCGHSINGAISAEMEFSNLSFPEAVKKVADYYGIPIESDEEKRSNNIRRQSDRLKDSFCEEQLKASGLTVDDVMAKVATSRADEFELVPAFRKGSLNIKGEPNFDDDEMLIFYYDLYGNPMKYATRGVAGALKQYIRIRWSNPDLHIGKDGKPAKYMSPKGSGVRFYFPQTIRDAFRERKHIDTLIIQEGEKKAEKACKHGIMSIGIQGIYNIGSAQEGLIQDLQYLVKACEIRNIVLLFDSDWDHLSKNLQPGDDIDQRPTQFAKAAIKFKTYVETLHNKGTSVDVWFGHIKETEKNEKGIDDLLVGTLKGSEDLLSSDIAETMKTHNGIGRYVDIHKISALTDYQIMEFWSLRNKDSFFKRHSNRFEGLSHFRFGKIYYKRDDSGEFVRSSTLGTDNDFWEVSFKEKDGKEQKECQFKLRVALAFLEANGFFKFRSPALGDQEYGFLSIDNNIIRHIGTFEIRDFIYTFAEQNCRDADVLDYLAEKLGSLLGNDKLERLREKTGLYESFEPEVQNRYYLNGQVRITPFSVEFGPMLRDIWKQNIVSRNFKRIPVIEGITFDPTDGFCVTPTADGEKCEFLRFLVNTSNFWRNEPEHIKQKFEQDFHRHIVNKITCIGFLLADYKYASERKAIVAMDAKMSEVGRSNGRSGKSMIGYAVDNMVEQTFIDGKKVSPDDPYIFSEVSEQTRNIFYDDARTNMNFESFFASITGKLAVNPKQMARFSIPWDRAPKFYITTNHALNADSPSALDRISFISFSDWYSTDNTPLMEFGHNFFYDWDEYQWNLFDNLMAECTMYYFRSLTLGWSKPGCGTVAPPMVDLKARQLRQKIGEAFLQWAESYFDPSGNNINNRIDRKNMYKAFLEDFPGQHKFVSPAAFKERLKAFCELKGLHINPHKLNGDKINFRTWHAAGKAGVFFGDRDSSNGNEYLTITDTGFAIDSAF